MDDPAPTASATTAGRRVGIANPHYSSGVGNHFFYLLAEGSGPRRSAAAAQLAVCAGGAGSTASEQGGQDLVPRADPLHGVDTNYIDARDATIHAAIDLYGKGSAECQVVKAWNAVTVPRSTGSATAVGLRRARATFTETTASRAATRAGKGSAQAVVTNDLNFGLPAHRQWFGLLQHTRGPPAPAR